MLKKAITLPPRHFVQAAAPPAINPQPLFQSLVICRAITNSKFMDSNFCENNQILCAKLTKQHVTQVTCNKGFKGDYPKYSMIGLVFI